jgi:hypothetical protein
LATQSGVGDAHPRGLEAGHREAHGDAVVAIGLDDRALRRPAPDDQAVGGFPGLDPQPGKFTTYNGVTRGCIAQITAVATWEPSLPPLMLLLE